jgi:hypothetical protein
VGSSHGAADVNGGAWIALCSLVISAVALGISVRALAHTRRQADAAERQAYLAMPPRLELTPSNHQPVVFLDHQGGSDLDNVTLEMSSEFLELDFVEPKLRGRRVELGPLRVGETRIFTPWFVNAFGQSLPEGRLPVRVVASAGRVTWPPFVLSFQLLAPREEP